MTRSLRFVFLLQLSLLIGVHAEAKTTTSMSSERGFFSLSLQAGANELRVLNSDGTFSAYRGTGGGAEADFRLLGSESGELRLFGRTSLSEMKSALNPLETLDSNQTLFGFKAFVGHTFYIGAGYGSNLLKFKTSTSEFSLSNPGPALGAGLEFHATGNFFVGLHAWYSNSALKYQTPLTGNSFAEGGAVYLNLIWSPPTTIINMVTVGK